MVRGPTPPSAGLATHIAERAAGNPFFTEEIVRDLLERGILEGRRGAYVCHRDTAEVNVPPTVQATIAARIDRLAPAAKGTLNAAAVIGSRFNANLLADIHGDVELTELVDTELIGALDSAGTEYRVQAPIDPRGGVRVPAEIGTGSTPLPAGHGDRATRAREGRGERRADRARISRRQGEQRAAYGWHMRAARWLDQP